MLPFILACFQSNLSGGGGGGPFAMSGVTISRNQSGTSCANPYKVNVSLSYTGSVSGITLTLEKSWDGGAWETVDTGLLPTDFPYVANVSGYYNKFGTWVGITFRVTDEALPSSVVTSDEFLTTYNRCDL